MHTQLKLFLFFLISLGVCLLLVSDIVPQPVDTLYLNGRIYTMDDSGLIAEGIAVRGEWIVAVGSSDELQRKYRPRTLLDLGGKTVLPGFIDAHAHFMSLGLLRMTLDLSGLDSEEEVGDVVRKHVEGAGEGEWIRGRGWDQNLWRARRFPTRAILDRVAPRNPVYLVRIDGHAAWVNSKALEIAGVTKETPDPEGGRILRDAAGHPTGVLIDAAMDLVAQYLPPPTREQSEQAVRLALSECLRYGIIGVHDMGVGSGEIELYREFIDRGEFPFRMVAAIDGPGETWEEFLRRGPLTGYGTGRLTVRAIKMYVDGALGSRGAALFEPYSDDPGNRGLTVVSEDQLRKVVDDALEHGFQVCTHAIGDRANNIVLNVYEAALRRRPVRDHRLRIEHAQVLGLNDLRRFKPLGVLPSMQPTHCTSDMYWAEARLGPARILGAYAWRSLLETGIVIPGGSDFPVEHPNPLYGVYAAVTRQDHLGRPRNASDVLRYFQLSDRGLANADAFDGGWYAAQRMDRQEAVKAFTIWAAMAGFQEEILGSLERGKLADFVILSKDIMIVEPQEILTTVVERTVVGGREVYAVDQSGVRLP